MYLKLIRSLKHEVAPFSKKWNVYKLFRVIPFSKLSKMGQFLLLWIEIQVLKGRMKCIQRWEECTFSFPIVFISSRKEIVNMHTYYYYFTPLLPIRILKRTLLTMYMIYFFPISYKFEHHKIYQADVFYSSCDPPEKNL